MAGDGFISSQKHTFVEDALGSLQFEVYLQVSKETLIVESKLEEWIFRKAARRPVKRAGESFARIEVAVCGLRDPLVSEV